MIAGMSALVLSYRHNGYYDYHGTTYYHYQNHWYVYNPEYSDYLNAHIEGINYDYDFSNPNENRGWSEVYDDPVVSEIESDYDAYFESKTWDSSISASSWNDTSFYDDIHSDSDYDWNSSDSWDSGGTDWDSDW